MTLCVHIVMLQMYLFSKEIMRNHHDHFRSPKKKMVFMRAATVRRTRFARTLGWCVREAGASTASRFGCFRVKITFVHKSGGTFCLLARMSHFLLPQSALNGLSLRSRSSRSSFLG